MFEFTENDLGEQTETHGMGESYLLTQKSDFDLKLAEKWSQLMKKGSFRYGLEDICSRIVGGKFGFVAQLQLNRSTNRRPPQAMLSLKQPFTKDKFNFTLINHEKEAIFTLQKTDEKRF
ncbi:GDP-D-glucose phosphorylase 1 isoform X2 [Eurytemora carolleeae]|uniref:GDP-D-glucose phosphorylase 1 isoform X2 n=1 Tax=Eurytemora carolleeae TaxID=1294199 RepID=UPI000C783139|nr:GDP-D-glucose phosphorylase 1 isoform X2 [Eurytemora carolleeae]|eukprot:XP_023345910.1 GDP-D-glucose phosphorylase 1-like isoform X2 [Eurytemora affinis]